MSASTFRVTHPIPGARPAEEGAAAPARVVVPRPVSLTSTVPRELVHRASVAEVMLTDWERGDDAHFTVAAQWPRRHGFFDTVEGCHDPLLVAETVRQAGILLAHAEFGVPLGHQFLMWDLEIDARREHLLVGATPASLDIAISCTDIKRRGTSLAGLHYRAVIRREGEVAATGAATFTCTSPAVYRRLRGARIKDGLPAALALTSPAPPQAVGRLSPADVVLSPVREPDCWQLRVDTRHPVLFDHPLDHVPGMALLEAVRQATSAFLGRACLPVGIATEFIRYAELDAPCLIQACSLPHHTDGRERVLVTGRQDGQLVFTSAVTVAPASG
ncbi:ScbA/BarX family gamma-butyrolactone biosynthesis protein [Streptomyces sp. MB09-02B]|uniref:ScbA/BarX family gamma-butyrolactone biosynthesis protein n=1 Tax=Streptomyces sp. MB09-02B TaxID=3028667 RepID=UPI0029A9CF86|nr:ScbA/BarX family gamma-butyrolactone biosynthesis protein [Streptomyces sp. MB09-02B]MDX3646340.1 ScbA/BarX family gamma-butyrolactone biosynthesis protein [Streptomyces sp. MB09-02B]